MNTSRIHTSALPDAWNQYYQKNTIPWESNGLSDTTRRFLDRYASGDKLLEIGCGNGADSAELASKGLQYVGIDISKEGITQAQSRQIPGATFTVEDIEEYVPDTQFNIVYDKGVFHNLPGPAVREVFAQKVRTLLAPNGIWITVCGSGDHYNPKEPHGAVFLQHIITPIELYFEVLEVVKAPYGIQKPHPDFLAWYCVFRKR
jgi:SAM-dependent methyltransferase